MPSIISILIVLALAPFVQAQFIPTLLQNRSYWGDGKSEIDFYEAEFIRDGEPHRCELLAILTPLFVEPETLARIDNSRQSPTIGPPPWASPDESAQQAPSLRSQAPIQGQATVLR